MNLPTYVYTLMVLCCALKANERPLLQEKPDTTKINEKIIRFMNGLESGTTFSIQLHSDLKKGLTIDTQDKTVWLSEPFIQAFNQGKQHCLEFELAQAYGRDLYKDDTPSLLTHDSPQASSCTKASLGGLFSASILTAGIASIYSLYNIYSPNPEDQELATYAAYTAAGLIPFTVFVGTRLLQAYGTSFHVTKKGYIQHRAEQYACSKLSYEELEALDEKLSGECLCNSSLKIRVAEEIEKCIP